MAAARSGQSGYVNRVSPLTPYFRELLILRIGWNCQAVYEWAKHVIGEHTLAGRVNAVLLSPVWGELGPKDLVKWVLEDDLPVRVQIQMHKVIWDADAQGV